MMNCLGAVSRAYRAVDNHARHRLRQWLNAKHHGRGARQVRRAVLYLHHELGLLRLESTTGNFPWAKA
jgi:cytochrome c biogenesis protein ResB